jgi:hypothetical protein
MANPTNNVTYLCALCGGAITPGSGNIEDAIPIWVKKLVESKMPGPYVHSQGKPAQEGLERVQTRVHKVCNSRMANEFEDATSSSSQVHRRLLLGSQLEGQPSSEDDARHLARWLVKTELMTSWNKKFRMTPDNPGRWNVHQRKTFAQSFSLDIAGLVACWATSHPDESILPARLLNASNGQGTEVSVNLTTSGWGSVVGPLHYDASGSIMHVQHLILPTMMGDQTIPGDFFGTIAALLSTQPEICVLHPIFRPAAKTTTLDPKIDRLLTSGFVASGSLPPDQFGSNPGSTNIEYRVPTEKWTPSKPIGFA